MHLESVSAPTFGLDMPVIPQSARSPLTATSALLMAVVSPQEFASATNTGLDRPAKSPFVSAVAQATACAPSLECVSVLRAGPEISVTSRCARITAAITDVVSHRTIANASKVTRPTIARSVGASTTALTTGLAQAPSIATVTMDGSGLPVSLLYVSTTAVETASVKSLDLAAVISDGLDFTAKFLSLLSCKAPQL